MTSSVPSRFAEVVRTHPDRPAARQRWGKDEWQTWTFSEMYQASHAAAAALLEDGVEAGDRVAIFSSNRVEWTQADVAAMSVGAIVVPVYPSLMPEQIRHILGHGGASVAFVDGQTELDKVLEVVDELPGLRRIVTFGPVDSHGDARVRLWAQYRSDDASLRDDVVARTRAITREDVASIIYTSGTTGDPKGVMITHGGFLSEFEALDVFFGDVITPEDHSLAFLPLSHALERAWSFYILSHGCLNTYVTNPKDIATYLVDVKPTLLVSVPALFEKIYAVAREKVGGSAAKRTIFRWANRVGGRIQRANRKGKQESLFWRSQLPLADRLVFRAIREAIGGPKTVLACGGAPLREEVQEFFSAAGVLILTGYGLTEASPLISFNPPYAWKFGTAGLVMHGGEVRIGQDAEILYRGPNVMKGYWNDDQATGDAIDAEGWLHTGDVGYVDNQGYVVITDRIKDLLITTGGKNIAPQPIEGLLLSDPLFEYAVLLGNNRPFVTLLVRPSVPVLEDLARELQIKWDNRDELFDNEEILEAVRQRVHALTGMLPRHEQIKELRLTKDEFTQENGLLTPTLKVKRREVEKRFADVIEDMYSRLAELRKKQGGGEKE